MKSIFCIVGVVYMSLLSHTWFISACDQKDELFKMICHDTTGKYNEDTVIHCTLGSVRSNTKVTKLIWMHGGATLIKFSAGSAIEETHDRITLYHKFQDSTTDVSLLIKGTQIKDKGRYECKVVSDAGISHGCVDLKVEAPYSVPIITKHQADGDKVILSCSSHGGYPKGEIQWTDWDGNNVSGEDRFSLESDDRYTLSSNLTINKSLLFYSCSVIKEGVTEHTTEYHEMQMLEASEVPDRARKAVIVSIMLFTVAVTALFLAKWSYISKLSQQNIVLDP